MINRYYISPQSILKRRVIITCQGGVDERHYGTWFIMQFVTDANIPIMHSSVIYTQLHGTEDSWHHNSPKQLLLITHSLLKHIIFISLGNGRRAGSVSPEWLSPDFVSLSPEELQSSRKAERSKETPQHRWELRTQKRCIPSKGIHIRERGRGS